MESEEKSVCGAWAGGLVLEAGWAEGGGREHTGVVGKPVNLSGCCVSTSSGKAEGDLVATVTVVGALLKPDSRPLTIYTTKKKR